MEESSNSNAYASKIIESRQTQRTETDKIELQSYMQTTSNRNVFASKRSESRHKTDNIELQSNVN